MTESSRTPIQAPAPASFLAMEISTDVSTAVVIWRVWTELESEIGKHPGHVRHLRLVRVADTDRHSDRHLPRRTTERGLRLFSSDGRHGQISVAAFPQSTLGYLALLSFPFR